MCAVGRRGVGAHVYRSPVLRDVGECFIDFTRSISTQPPLVQPELFLVGCYSVPPFRYGD